MKTSRLLGGYISGHKSGCLVVPTNVPTPARVSEEISKGCATIKKGPVPDPTPATKVGEWGLEPKWGMDSRKKKIGLGRGWLGGLRGW